MARNIKSEYFWKYLKACTLIEIQERVRQWREILLEARNIQRTLKCSPIPLFIVPSTLTFINVNSLRCNMVFLFILNCVLLISQLFSLMTISSPLYKLLCAMHMTIAHLTYTLRTAHPFSPLSFPHSVKGCRAI